MKLQNIIDFEHFKNCEKGQKNCGYSKVHMYIKDMAEFSTTLYDQDFKMVDFF